MIIALYGNLIVTFLWNKRHSSKTTFRQSLPSLPQKSNVIKHLSYRRVSLIKSSQIIVSWRNKIVGERVARSLARITADRHSRPLLLYHGPSRSSEQKPRENRGNVAVAAARRGWFRDPVSSVRLFSTPFTPPGESKTIR